MEKAICFQRSQLIVMLRATMSTSLSCRADPLCSGDHLELVGVLVAEDRLGNGLHHVDVEAFDLAGQRVACRKQVGFADTPATSRPRSWILRMVEPLGMSPAVGSAPAGS